MAKDVTVITGTYTTVTIPLAHVEIPQYLSTALAPLAAHNAL